MNRLKRFYFWIRYWFFCFKEDPKYLCRYDDLVQGAYSRGFRDGLSMQRKGRGHDHGPSNH